MSEGGRKKRRKGSSASCAFAGWPRQNVLSHNQLLFAPTAAQAIPMHFQVTVNVQVIITETLYTAPSSSRVEMFPAKIFHCIFFLPFIQVINEIQILRCWALAKKLLFMLKSRIGACWICKPALWNCEHIRALYRGMHIHLGFSQVARDPFLILGWNYWFWL